MVFRYATAELVAQTWASQIVGVPSGDQLPADNTTWAASGFVVCADVGGSSNPYYQLDSPVFTFQCWTCDPTSAYPSWPRARNLTAIIQNECYQNVTRYVTLPGCDQNARVLQTQQVGRVRRKWGDIGDYACYQLDVLLHWVPMSKP